MVSRVALVLVLGLGCAPAWAVDILVQVNGANGKPLADVAVMVLPENAATTRPAQSTAVVDQVNRAFVPHVSVVTAGTLVSFPNSDDIRHHVYSFSDAKTFELPLYQGTPSQPVKFDSTGIVAIACNIHDWMLGYIYVTDSAWHGVTGEQGSVQLSVPEAARYTITAWHPMLGVESAGISEVIYRASNQTLEVALELRGDVATGSRRLRRGGGRYR